IEMTTDAPSQPPKSPYSANRALLQDLTLPPNPNTAIPPSPPLSPTLLPKINSLTAKFDNFLKLKREKGIHFNERIAQSHGLRNPAVMEQLLTFAGIGTSFDGDDDNKGTEQYATTLSREIWDPLTGFPGWAYKDALWKSQIKTRKERERGRGERVEFVSAGSSTTSGDSGGVLPDLRTGLPGQQQLGRESGG
ncbi:HCNGP-like protein-domain-containing protein, partial [Apiosordaria backusii]